MAHHVSITTRDERSYEGALVSGEFLIDGTRIPASRILSLYLPWIPEHSGNMRLVDHSCFTVRGTTQGWFSTEIVYELCGRVSVHIDSLDSDVTVEVMNIKHMSIQQVATSSERLTLQTMFLSELEAWLKKGLIAGFSHHQVNWDGFHWDLRVDFCCCGEPAGRSSTMLALHRAATSFGADVATRFALKLLDVAIDDYGPRLQVRLTK